MEDYDFISSDQPFPESFENDYIQETINHDLHKESTSRKRKARGDNKDEKIPKKRTNKSQKNKDETLEKSTKTKKETKVKKARNTGTRRVKPSESNFVFGLGDLQGIPDDKTVLHQWYRVPLSNISQQELSKIEDILTVKPSVVDFMTKEDIPPVAMFHKDEKRLYVPPYFGIQRFGKPEIDLTRPGIEISCKFSEKYTMDPKLKQDQAFAALIDSLHKVGSAYIALHPGGGKTVVATKAGTEIKRRFAILVTKEFLVLQWKSRLAQFMPEGKVAVVKGNTIEVPDDADCVIIMLQSLLYKLENDKIHALMETIGFTIIDESRHINARSFSKVLPLISSRYMLALDGTPRRSDGMDMILRHWIGPVTFLTKREYKFPVRVKVIPTTYTHPREKYLKNGDYNRGRMVTELTKISSRNKDIDRVLFDLSETTKQVLILGDRVDHLQILEDNLKKAVPNVSSGQFHAGITKKPEKLAELESKQFIFATHAMAEEALDFTGLSVLVYATPRPNPRQSVGRIIRGLTDNEPLIYEFNDEYSFFLEYAEKRHSFFRNEGFEIEYASRAVAEAKKKRGVEIFERDGWFVLKKQKTDKTGTVISIDDNNEDMFDDMTERFISEMSKKQKNVFPDTSKQQPPKKKPRCPF